MIYLCDVPNVFTSGFKEQYVRVLSNLTLEKRDAIKAEIHQALDAMTDPEQENNKKRYCELAIDEKQNNPLSAMLYIKKGWLTKNCTVERGSLKKIADIKTSLEPKAPDNDTLEIIIHALTQAVLNHQESQVDECLHVLHGMYLESRKNKVILTELQKADEYLKSHHLPACLAAKFHVMCQRETTAEITSDSLEKHPYLSIQSNLDVQPSAPPPSSGSIVTQPPSLYGSTSVNLLFLPPPPPYHSIYPDKVQNGYTSGQSAVTPSASFIGHN
jgi:lipopolysaccharide biosynthesis regulator YciM